MNLYLLRHGPAEEPERYKSDHLRPLSNEGRDRTVQAAAGITEIIGDIDIIVSSPLLRAQQTAQIYAKALRYKGTITESRYLTPDSSPGAALTYIDTLLKHNSALLVSHQPFLSLFASTILGSSSPCIEFKKGALAKFEFLGSHYNGILEWHLPARLQRKCS